MIESRQSSDDLTINEANGLLETQKKTFKMRMSQVSVTSLISTVKLESLRIIFGPHGYSAHVKGLYQSTEDQAFLEIFFLFM